MTTLSSLDQHSPSLSLSLHTQTLGYFLEAVHVLLPIFYQSFALVSGYQASPSISNLHTLLWCRGPEKD